MTKNDDKKMIQDDKKIIEINKKMKKRLEDYFNYVNYLNHAKSAT